MTYATSEAIDPNLTDDRSIQTRPACLIEGLSPTQRDQHRTQVLTRFNLLGAAGATAGGAEAVSIFDEATQTVSRLLAMPICMLSVVDDKMQHLKSVVGLSSLGLMNPLAATRSIPRQESFCTHVIDSGKTFVLENATAHPAFSRSLLVHQYGIQSYLGVPLFTAEGCCIGTLAVMDLLPHKFTQQEVICLELTARWCISEFEKQHMHSKLQQETQPLQAHLLPGELSGEAQGTANQDSLLSKINQVRFDLIVQLTQDLRNPLMSITGMANMLSREIYGPLSEKQQEYAKIVLSSSQQLLTMVNEIVEVGDLEEGGYRLVATTVDIEMIAQQAIASLSNLAQQQDLEIKLTVEPGSRIWSLDKRVVKQLIYHLVFSIIKMSTAGSTIRLHVSHKDASISIALWVSNPWLGEDLPQAVIAWGKSNASTGPKTRPNAGPETSLLSQSSSSTAYPSVAQPVAQHTISDFSMQSAQSASEEVFAALATAQKVDASRQELGLLLSRHLTEIHGGKAQVQGSATNGHRYIIVLPSLPASN